MSLLFKDGTWNNGPFRALYGTQQKMATCPICNYGGEIGIPVQQLCGEHLTKMYRRLKECSPGSLVYFGYADLNLQQEYLIQRVEEEIQQRVQIRLDR